MYHEEKIIDGILQWRGTPDGEFQPYSLEAMAEKWTAMNERIMELRKNGNLHH